MSDFFPGKEEKKVEYIELIYDLIFVYLIGRNNSLLHSIQDGFIQPKAFLTYILSTLIVLHVWYFSMLFINPRVKPQHLYPYTIISCLVSLAGFGLLLICPLGNNILLFIAIALISLSYGALKTIADSLLALEMTSEHSSGLYSISFILSSVLGIIAIQVLQGLYTLSPDWLFGSSAIIIILVLADALFLRPKK